MKPKEYLMQIQELYWSIYINQEAIERARARLDIHGISYDRDKVQTTPEDSMPDLVAALIKLEDVTDAKYERLLAMIQTITEQINQLDDITDRRILYMRYVKGNTLGAIARELHYSYDWMKHRHGMALRKFGEIFHDLSRFDTK